MKSVAFFSACIAVAMFPLSTTHASAATEDLPPAQASASTSYPASDYSLPDSIRDPATVAQEPLIPNTHPSEKRPADQYPAEEAKIHEIVSPYAKALTCLSTQLNPAQKQESFSVGTIRDGTGQVNAIADAGTGTFMSQAAEDMMLTSLTEAGVITVDNSLGYHQQVDWNLGKAESNLAGDGNEYVYSDHGKPSSPTKILHAFPGTVMIPNVLILGSVSTLDFIPGAGAEITAPIQIGHRKYQILVSIDIRAVRMPKGAQMGGQVIASDRATRIVFATDDEFGLSQFFGPKGSPTYVAFDFGKQTREALQAIQRVMEDREAAIMVAKVNGITACDAQIAYGDELAFQAR